MTDVAFHIGTNIRASSYFFNRRAADVVPEACFTAITEDRHDELTAMDLSVIAVDTGIISVNFNSYASLVIFFIIPVLYCFVFYHETLLIIRVLAVFDFYYRTYLVSLPSN